MVVTQKPPTTTIRPPSTEQPVVTPERFEGPKPEATLPEKEAEREQLRRDRILGVVMLLVIVAVFALMIWLGSLGTIPEGTDYPTMPVPPYH